MRLITASFVALLVAGCASYEPVPPGYAGDTATVTDNGFSEESTRARTYALVAIDGRSVMNGFIASRNASAGQGARLTMVLTERLVPAKPMKVTLRASTTTGAPIHAIAAQLAGTFFSVEGVVDFSPEPNRRYSVRANLEKDSSSVWIEDEATGQPVTKKVVK